MGKANAKMFEPTTKELVTQFLETPMVEWPDRQHGLYNETKQEMVCELDALIERACRLRAYLDTRSLERWDGIPTDQIHAKAVRRQNALATKVRRLLGYSRPQLVVTF